MALWHCHVADMDFAMKKKELSDSLRQLQTRKTNIKYIVAQTERNCKIWSKRKN